VGQWLKEPAKTNFIEFTSGGTFKTFRMDLATREWHPGQTGKYEIEDDKIFIFALDQVRNPNKWSQILILTELDLHLKANGTDGATRKVESGPSTYKRTEGAAIGIIPDN
jgi:hypothetical protein